MLSQNPFLVHVSRMALRSHIPHSVLMMDAGRMPPNESPVVVLVPEAEAVAKPFRDRYDPSAAAGMPAHITLLYPFKAPDEIDDITLGKLRSCFTSFKPIQFSLSAIQRFPIAVLYFGSRA